jgi:cell wall-associated NlpC family hydrolase
MKYFSCLFLIIFFTSMSLFSQEKLKKHTVNKGETISEIAKKYNVKPSAIYELNPDAVNGIKLKTVLLIPTNSQKSKASSTTTITDNQTLNNHEVLPKETLYGIAKQYNLAIEDLYKNNPNLEKEGLKIGQSIKIPQGDIEKNAVAKPVVVETLKGSKKNNQKEEVVLTPKGDEKKETLTQEIQYEVLPKESLYSISKKYGISLTDLQKANPELGTKSIKVGQKINVPVKADANIVLVENNVKPTLDLKTENASTEKKPVNQTPNREIPVVENKKLEAEKSITVVSKATNDDLPTTTITHEVLPKESLYSISKKYAITLSDLQKANPELGKKSLKVGQKITVPIKADANSDLVVEKSISNKELQTDKKLIEKEQTKQIDGTQQANAEVKNPETETTHEVLPKETKFGIAKQYGITVTELEKQNPTISRKLLVGSMLKIRSSKVVEKAVPAEVVVVEEKRIEENTNANPVMERNAAFVDQLISKASENLGTRYRSGGNTTAGFDCSGLMCYAFSSYDIKLPRSSIEMASYGAKIDSQNAQKGDLIFFKTRGSGRINHVGMVVEVLDGEIKFIHSANHGGVIISSTKESYYQRNLAQVNRVL